MKEREQEGKRAAAGAGGGAGAANLIMRWGNACLLVKLAALPDAPVLGSDLLPVLAICDVTHLHTHAHTHKSTSVSCMRKNSNNKMTSSFVLDCKISYKQKRAKAQELLIHTETTTTSAASETTNKRENTDTLSCKRPPTLYPVLHLLHHPVLLTPPWPRLPSCFAFL